MPYFIEPSPTPDFDYVKVSKQGKRIKMIFIDEFTPNVLVKYSRRFAKCSLWQLKDRYNEYYRKIDVIFETMRM